MKEMNLKVVSLEETAYTAQKQAEQSLRDSKSLLQQQSVIKM